MSTTLPPHQPSGSSTTGHLAIDLAYLEEAKPDHPPPRQCSLEEINVNQRALIKTDSSSHPSASRIIGQSREGSTGVERETNGEGGSQPHFSVSSAFGKVVSLLYEIAMNDPSSTNSPTVQEAVDNLFSIVHHHQRT
ncbi:hypothetical protein NMY22_g10169 [Coprinellus aureogranulatus]|nr:hypothetical protein NMY22_g10169 [Coprinellus aureogranulatus]